MSSERKERNYIVLQVHFQKKVKEKEAMRRSMNRDNEANETQKVE